MGASVKVEYVCQTFSMGFSLPFFHFEAADLLVASCFPLCAVGVGQNVAFEH